MYHHRSNGNNSHPYFYLDFISSHSPKVDCLVDTIKIDRLLGRGKALTGFRSSAVKGCLLCFLCLLCDIARKFS